MPKEPHQPWPPQEPYEPWPTVNGPGSNDRPWRWTRGMFALVLVILATAAVGMAVTIGQGHQDSAMLFVGLPTLLALAIALSPPARNAYGITAKAITVALLCAAVMLHEGAICVLLAAPLVYAVGLTVAAIVRRSLRGTMAVVPLALLLGMEGMTPGLRAVPDQTVTRTRTVSLAPAEVGRRIAEGPDLTATEPSFLLGNMPLPRHVAGSGIDPGDRWVFHFDGDNHGPGGILATEVVEELMSPTGGRVTFRTVSDASIVARWLDWNTAVLEWHATDADTVTVTLTVHFTRGLDPSWYFGPLENAMVGASGEYLLDTLGLARP